MQISKREKYILIGGGVSFFLMLLYLFVISPIFEKISKMEKEIERKNKELSELIAKKDELLKTKQLIEIIESRISEEDKFSAATVIEELAKSSNISTIDGIEKKSSPQDEYYKEELWEISFKDVTLKEVVNFLIAIENYQNLLILKKLYMKTDPKDRDKLKEIKIQISTFGKNRIT